MRALGFTRNGRFYAHPNTRFTVEFPTGPLSVGAEIITEWAKRERGDECLYVLSAFDAVRDRLCGYFYYHDFSALAAAVAIARRHDVDIAALQEWVSANSRETVHTIKLRKFNFLQNRCNAIKRALSIQATIRWTGTKPIIWDDED